MRTPTPSERALLDTLLRADVVQPVTLRAQLEGLLVSEMPCAGAASLDLRVRDAAPRLAAGHPTVIADAEGLDTGGQKVTVSLLAGNGVLARLELLYLGTAAPAPIDVDTLHQLDAVPRGTRELVWLVARKKPILGASE